MEWDCPQCSEKNENAVLKCSCGCEQPQIPEVKVISENKKNLSGVGGWLALLVFGLMIFGPLMSIGQKSSEFYDIADKFPSLLQHPKFGIYKQLSWTVCWIQVIISFLAGYRLLKVHSFSTVKYATISLWLAGPIVYFLHISLIVVLFGTSSLGGAIAGIFGPLVSAIIWSLYLSTSIRVKNTYL